MVLMRWESMFFQSLLHSYTKRHSINFWALVDRVPLYLSARTDRLWFLFLGLLLLIVSWGSSDSLSAYSSCSLQLSSSSWSINRKVELIKLWLWLVPSFLELQRIQEITYYRKNTYFGGFSEKVKNRWFLVIFPKLLNQMCSNFVWS